MSIEKFSKRDRVHELISKVFLILVSLFFMFIGGIGYLGEVSDIQQKRIIQEKDKKNIEETIGAIPDKVKKFKFIDDNGIFKNKLIAIGSYFFFLYGIFLFHSQL